MGQALTLAVLACYTAQNIIIQINL